MAAKFQGIEADSTLLLLPSNELHVWRASLDCDPQVLERTAARLMPDEAERAKRFLVPSARNEFSVARGILRELLALYLGPGALTTGFAYGPRGKPALPPEHCSLQFNVSHSHGLAAIVIARHKKLGIDIEEIRQDFGVQDIANLHFSDAEAAELEGLPKGLQAAGFFKCWTRKEAFLKARGDGLQLPLSSFQVSITTDEPQELLDEAGERWTVYAFEPAVGFAGAVAAQGGDCNLRFWEWPALTTSFVQSEAGFTQQGGFQKPRLTVR